MPKAKPKRVTIDITPAGIPVEALNEYRTGLIGSSHRDKEGNVIGEIRRTTIKNGRIIAEVMLKPKVILG